MILAVNVVKSLLMILWLYHQTEQQKYLKASLKYEMFFFLFLQMAKSYNSGVQRSILFVS